MAARELRYRWFEEIRLQHGYNYIATAHHLDDQAETLFINLIRGTGIAGLHGIPVKNDRVIRPLMFAEKKALEGYARKYDIAYREDHTNSETKYLRNRIRHEILPVIKAINPEFVENLNKTITIISATEKLADQRIGQIIPHIEKVDEHQTVIDLKALFQNEEREVIAWSIFSRYGFTETQVKNLMKTPGSPQEKVFLSVTHRMMKERDKLVIVANPGFQDLKEPAIIDQLDKENELVINYPVSMKFRHLLFDPAVPIPAQSYIATLDFSKLLFPLILRKWKKGDKFRPFGMRGQKKVSDFFVDQKMSRQQKNGTWLLCSGDQIVWVIGRRIDDRFKVTKNTRETLVAELMV
jgi:tRNA(Ile)-lysidine synthase